MPRNKNKKKMSNVDICVVCHDTNEHLISLKCGHSYENKHWICLDCYNENSIQNCPVCRTPLPSETKEIKKSEDELSSVILSSLGFTIMLFTLWPFTIIIGSAMIFLCIIGSNIYVFSCFMLFFNNIFCGGFLAFGIPFYFICATFSNIFLLTVIYNIHKSKCLYYNTYNSLKKETVHTFYQMNPITLYNELGS